MKATLYQSWINYYKNFCQKIRSGKLFSFSILTDPENLFSNFFKLENDEFFFHNFPGCVEKKPWFCQAVKHPTATSAAPVSTRFATNCICIDVYDARTLRQVVDFHTVWTSPGNETSNLGRRAGRLQRGALDVGADGGLQGGRTFRFVLARPLGFQLHRAELWRQLIDCYVTSADCLAMRRRLFGHSRLEANDLLAQAAHFRRFLLEFADSAAKRKKKVNWSGTAPRYVVEDANKLSDRLGPKRQTSFAKVRDLSEKQTLFSRYLQKYNFCNRWRNAFVFDHNSTTYSHLQKFNRSYNSPGKM